MGTLIQLSRGKFKQKNGDAFGSFTTDTTSWYSLHEEGGIWYIALAFRTNIDYIFKNWVTGTETNYRRKPQLDIFPLTDIDEIREYILATSGNISIELNNLEEFPVPSNLDIVVKSLGGVAPTDLENSNNILNLRYSQNGLLVKTVS